MQSLSGSGHRVFALGLAHKNGDGYIWSEQIANAIEVIRQRTGAATKTVWVLAQGLFAKLVADRSPPELRGSAYGVLNLATGLWLLAASVIAGVA